MRSPTAAVLALALFPAVQGLRLGGAAPGDASLPRSFAACGRPEPCGPRGLESHYLLDLLSRVQGASRRVLAANRTPTLLHIGAATLNSLAKFADQDLYRRVHALLPPEARESYRMVLVEPNSALFTELEGQAAKLPCGYGRVKIVKGMVADSCKEATNTMYRFSHQVEREFGVNFNFYGTWFSSDPTFPTRALGGFLLQPKPTYLNESAWDGLRRLHDSANVTSYIEAAKVPCFTPASLLASAGIQAGDLAMVVVDAEGFDVPIVGELRKLPGFKPGYLQFEGTLDFPWEKYLAEDLRNHFGFKVGRTYAYAGNYSTSDADNIVAVSE